MIRCIYSSSPSFKTLEFHSGLNVLVAEKEVGATDRQTRNRAGKTSLIEIVHFLLGADVKKDSLFRTPTLVNECFSMTFDLGGEQITMERCGKDSSKIYLSENHLNSDGGKITNSEWLSLLGKRMFRLDAVQDYQGRKPSFRSLFSYFARRQSAGGFIAPEKHAIMQQAGDFQVALMFLLGVDWHIASDWQQVRDREKTLKELKKAASTGVFGSLIGKASDLRTELTLAESRLGKLQGRVTSFRVLSQYRDLEVEADKITRDMNTLANDNTLDMGTIRDLEAALQAEAPPQLTDLDAVYREAGVVLPDVALRRYEEVRSFHESVIRNRQDYLNGELVAARQRIELREQQKIKLDQRRAEIMGILQSHGALEQFSKLQGELGRLEAEVKSLRQRFGSAEQLEGTKNELDIERNQLTLRLRRDFSEQKHCLAEAIIAFEDTSKRLYESAGSMKITETANGPIFDFPMQGERSKGIKNMQIFCFDMMLMRLCAERGIGPGFLIHDSHLFDGVDGRQVISALKLGAEMAEELGFQYVVTMNEDDAFKEKITGFDLKDYMLPVVLTDATEDGGLFGVRF